ncbi:MAG: hypothetical protein M3088_01325, partial [Actinomycetota bacterium]|nr:hypothetical protein [Actinomycetota bacterium]
ESGEGNLLPYVRVAVPAHPTLEQVADLLDATGGNVAIRTIDRWKSSWLRATSQTSGARKCMPSAGSKRRPQQLSSPSATPLRTRAHAHSLPCLTRWTP